MHRLQLALALSLASGCRRPVGRIDAGTDAHGRSLVERIPPQAVTWRRYGRPPAPGAGDGAGPGGARSEERAPTSARGAV